MFHLNFIPEVSKEKINHQQQILFIGSCFSERISSKLEILKFNTLTNPLGIVFNPKSIYTTLSTCIANKSINDQHYFERDDTWFNFDIHSSLFAKQKNTLKNITDEVISNWHQKLKTANLLVITFGSANCYELNKTQMIVSNCHKLAGNCFTKKTIDVNEIVIDYEKLINDLKKINPALNIIFTVSPVKHIRDGIIENNLSKSILIQSVHTLVSKHSNCFYFPAYELVIDDLRDYRFYEPDMAHPNSQAIDYVFSKFENVYFNDKTKTLCRQLTEINLAFLHRVYNAESESYKLFKKNMVLKCEALIKEYSFINLTNELNYFSN